MAVVATSWPGGAVYAYVYRAGLAALELDPVRRRFRLFEPAVT